MDPSGAGSKRKTVQLVEPERAAPEMAPAVGRAPPKEVRSPDKKKVHAVALALPLALLS